jgi:hypothetical protein|tara:strand:- start:1028 stop:1312 length:285 start_codon:yes stop_codon:yes gene_type:complete
MLLHQSIIISIGIFIGYILLMKIKNIDRYQRLRDFHVPISVLDDIFGNQDNLSILNTAWDALINDDCKGDDIAKEISQLIFRDLDIIPEEDTEE